MMKEIVYEQYVETATELGMTNHICKREKFYEDIFPEMMRGLIVMQNNGVELMPVSENITNIAITPCIIFNINEHGLGLCGVRGVESPNYTHGMWQAPTQYLEVIKSQLADLVYAATITKKDEHLTDFDGIEVTLNKIGAQPVRIYCENNESKEALLKIAREENIPIREVVRFNF